MKNYLNEILKQTNIEASETYEQALDNCFKYYLDEECNEDDNIEEARAEFEKSNYYFLKVEDFEKSKIENLNSLKNEAQKIIVNAIDTSTLEELKNLKKIFNQILKIIDSNQVDFDNDCRLVF